MAQLRHCLGVPAVFFGLKISPEILQFCEYRL